MSTLRTCLISFAVSLCTMLHAAAPVSAYMGFAEVETLTVAPDGKHLALTHRKAEHELLTILSYPDIKPVISSHFGDMIDIADLYWVDGDRLLIQPARRFYGWRAYKVPTGEIIRVDVSSKNSDLLFGFRTGGITNAVVKTPGATIMPKRENTDAWANIVSVQTGDPDYVLIHTGSYDSIKTQDALQRLNIKNGRFSRIAGSPVTDSTFITDAKHQLVLVYGRNAKGDTEVHRFKPDDKTWQLVSTGKDLEGDIEPVEQAASGEYIALDSLNSPTQSVIAWKPAGNERRVLFESKVSDVRTAGFDANDHVYAFEYEDHYPEYWYPDPEHPLARAHALLRQKFKDANVWITSATNDLSLAVAVVSAPRIPETFYLVDVKNAKLLQALPAYPALKPEDLSPTDPVEIKVRDGLAIRGYLTTPRGSSGKNMPMIVTVHGGPHGVHDSYDFDPEVQLLASRGYAVLQMNYRGSGGRGKEFERAGYGRWGREMQDDLTDSVKWAIAAGVADRNRICIYGASYGAYAALTGAFREPALFKCAVGMAGVYDLPLLFDKGDIAEDERNLNYLRNAVGTDVADMRSRSPVYNADKIRIPVMLIHGEEDARAPIEHARRLRAALEKAGNAPVWIVESGEAHGLGSDIHRNQVYEQMLAFFAKHLGP